MADPALSEELRARLIAAGRQVHRTLGPDDDSRALAREVRTAGLCAQICPVAEGPDAASTGWRHDICVLAPDHLDRHRSVLWARWGLDWHEMRDRALALADRVRAVEERADELADELVGTRDALALATRDRGHWRDAVHRARELHEPRGVNTLCPACWGPGPVVSPCATLRALGGDTDSTTVASPEGT